MDKTSLKLMIVDDEADVCDYLGAFFKERNFSVSVAYNGKEAVRLCESENPEIMLLDMTMPVMNGIEVLKKIKDREKPCRVIMLTRVKDPDKMREARINGAIEYITKPFALEHLEKTVLSMAEAIRTGRKA